MKMKTKVKQAPGQDSVAQEDQRGPGVAIGFLYADALAFYKEVTSHGIAPRRPFVGNRMWLTNLPDRDGYRLCFESPTEAPQERVFSEAI